MKNICIILVIIFTIILLINLLTIKNSKNNLELYSIKDQINKIYFINLDHRKDRKNQFLSNFNNNKIEIERIPAIYTPENGALGCLKSHILCLKRCLQDNNELNFICEDDLKILNLETTFLLINKVINTFPNWDVILIGRNTYEDKGTSIYEKNIEIRKILHATTTSGYIVRKKYIVTLLKKFEDTLHQYNKSGKWIEEMCVDQCWKKLQKTDNWYSFSPKIAEQRKSYSDIEKRITDYKV
jgi:GR25 family glycosyltransferase involved in LPS biosynthesis